MPGAESVLRTAQQRHPRDVWVNYELGTVLEKLSRRDEAIRFYTAARSIRPETAHELAHALEKRGDSDEAIAVFRDLNELRPGNARHLGCLGKVLKAKGLSREADEAFEAAVAAGREAVRLKPDDASAHLALGYGPQRQGKLDEAIAEFRDGDPAQARRRRGPRKPRPSPCRTRASSTRPSPNFARRSGSCPTTPHAHALGSGLECPGETRPRPSPNFARRSGSSPTMRHSPLALGTALIAQGKLDARRRRIPRGDPAHARRCLRPFRPRQGPDCPGEAGPRRRRIP